MTTTTDDRRILDVLEARAAAIRSKDVDRTLATYAPDTINFDLPPPLQYVGPDALDPKGLGGWFDTWIGPIGLDQRDLRVSASGDLALALGLVRLSGQRTGGEMTDIWVRQTFGLRRTNGAWRIIHEHTSVPFYMDGSYRAAVDLKP
jgi:ketosteroid isomerase-like protein